MIASFGDRATEDLYRLEALRGKLKGHQSIRINDQWRIVFRWVPGEASQVRITDYHS